MLAGVFFAAITVLMTWPQAAHLGDGAADLLDAKLSAWILHWDFVQTLRDPLNLFQAPILSPARYVLAFSENLYGAAVFGFPLLAAGASAFFNYNAVLLLGMFLSALCAWALARYVTGDPLASLAAGVVYGFLPYKLSQLPHIHMEWGPFLCLVFLYLLRYLDGGKRRDAILLGVFFAWNFIASIQYAFFTAFLVAVALLMEGATGGPQRGRRIAGALAAMAVAGVACLPFAIPYAKASHLYGMRRSVGEMTFFSATPGYFLSAGARNKLYGPLTAAWRGNEGDFFPGLLPVALAAVAIAGLRRGRGDSTAPRVSRRRLRVARAFDVAIVLLVACWVLVRVHPHLRIGPLSLGDSGRVQVFLTAAALVRLALGFPGHGRYASLADFFRRCGLDRRALLLLVVAATGVVVCLGGHTPYYLFLFQSFGSIFRAIRVAARGVVLFQAALAVLAAWGLSLCTRGRTGFARGGLVALALGGIILEYRALPIEMLPYDGRPLPVYEWLRDARFSGGVVELPQGFPHDCEYTLRQAEHGKPLVNGHSSFAPKLYESLYAQLHVRPIPDAVWSTMAELRGNVLVYHPREATPAEAGPYRRLLRRGVEEGRLELVASFPEPGGLDFVFHRAGAPALEARLPAGAAESARRAFDDMVRSGGPSTPFGGLHLPREGQVVESGFWAFGFALDDSGIAAVRVATELGPAPDAQLGGTWPGLTEAFPQYADAAHGGFGFPVPSLPPGPHALVVTLVGREGGEFVITRRVVVR